MITKRNLIGGLAFLCVAVLLFSAIPVIGQTGDFDPWADALNDDGYVGIDDIFYVASHFAEEGTPIRKAAVLYDSGWLDITNKCGKNITITHNLTDVNWSSPDVLVDIQGQTYPGGEPLRHTGLVGPILGWNRTYGGTGSEQASSVIQTSDGGFILAGRTNSSGAGKSDVWLIKTGSQGVHLWNRTYGGPDEDFACCLIETEDGSFVVGGTTNSTGTGGLDSWLLKTDASGILQWSKTYGGSNDDSAGLALIQTADDGYALVGTTQSYGAGNSDFLLIKTDASGNLQWNKTYGGPSLEEGWSLVQTDDGGYALAGFTNSSGAGDTDFWLVKTSAVGSMEWNRTYGGAFLDKGYAIVLTADGGFALVGYSNPGFPPFYDCRLIKTDSDGNMQWSKTYGGSSMDFAWCLIQTLDGGFAMGGGTVSYGAGGYDCWIVKTDSGGNALWNMTFGGSQEDVTRGLVQTSDGRYAMVGETHSFGAGINDCCLVMIDSETGLAWIDSTENDLILRRGFTDADWNFVRVRICKIRETP